MKTMFRDIPKPMLDRMKALEARDARDRKDDTAKLKRLRQIPPETGMLISVLAAGAPEGQVLEIGTSAGYSAMWLSLASKVRKDKLVTFELLPDKADLARETISKSDIGDFVELVHGDARGHLSDFEDIAFCFLDSEKEMYDEFYDLIVPKLIAGGLLVVDNAISHEDDLKAFLKKARKDKAIDALVLNVGKGLLLCSKLG
jgi:predicted O-methyltransferase YrrM